MLNDIINEYTCWEVEYRLKNGDGSHKTFYFRSKEKAVEAISIISKNGGIVYSMGEIHRTVFDGFSETVGEYAAIQFIS